ncbi:hypothetical protein M2G59_21295 [Vibrio vulnificus]|nr:hypothetical protein [Vibrio vulnificus]MCU8282518.1 hypothetical protein [Vibrio vulnificus]
MVLVVKVACGKLV